jgi:transmembrane protein 216
MDIAPISSLPFHAVTRFDQYYCLFLYLAEALLLLFKCYLLPYSSLIQFREAALLFLLVLVSYFKNDLLIRGNKTENASLVLAGMLLAIVAVAGVVFFMLLQYYVLLIEIVLNAVMLCALGF